MWQILVKTGTWVELEEIASYAEWNPKITKQLCQGSYNFKCVFLLSVSKVEITISFNWEHSQNNVLNA